MPKTTEKHNAQGYLGSNLTPDRENRNFRKQLSSTAQKHYADLEDTCRDKVTKVGVTVRYTKNVIEKNEGWGHI
jgi:DNA/RNA endonuclease G (NUC1)